ncbi:MAG: hypothetical protein ABI680_15990, partial [Chthoniobacteraceae bacterium]
EFARCMAAARAYLKGGGAGSKVELHGYASEEGSPAFNQELSEKRAHIVKVLFGQGGVAPAGLAETGHGADKHFPKLEENRRVEIVLDGSVPKPITLPEDEIEPFKPVLPDAKTPEKPVGPEKPAGSPEGFCVPFGSTTLAMVQHAYIKATMMAFTSSFGPDVEDLWRTYFDTPKVGTKGTLPKRRTFGEKNTRVASEFREDPETLAQRNRLMELMVARVPKDSTLMPPVGRTTDFLPFRTIFSEKELLDLPMKFGDPATRIPGLIAGGFGKNSSDAGDDVRNVDGQFRVTNQGGDTFRLQAKFFFDVQDCVDFCPGAPGGFLAQKITIPISQLEATPDIPTYDTPFEVVFGASEERRFVKP